ncbi:hypothetical protein Tco_0361299 [Tanacetum coccineum]
MGLVADNGPQATHRGHGLLGLRVVATDTLSVAADDDAGSVSDNSHTQSTESNISWCKSSSKEFKIKWYKSSSIESNNWCKSSTSLQTGSFDFVSFMDFDFRCGVIPFEVVIMVVGECEEISGVHWWRSVEKVVVERRRYGGVIVVEDVE